MPSGRDAQEVASRRRVLAVEGVAMGGAAVCGPLGAARLPQVNCKPYLAT